MELHIVDSMFLSPLHPYDAFMFNCLFQVNGFTPLHVASHYSHVDVLSALLAAGANRDAATVRRGHATVILLLYTVTRGWLV